MVSFITESGKAIFAKGSECKYGQMEQSIKVSGRMVRPMERVID